MMAGIAYRYAKALLSLATENNQLEEISNDMRLIDNTIADSKDLKAVLRNPIIKNSQKRSCLQAIFNDVNKNTTQLFDVLIDNKRIALLDKVTVAFVGLVDELDNVVAAKVSSAVPLNEDARNEIVDKIKTITKSKKVILSTRVDKDLIGGFLLRIDDLQYDASIARKLNNLRHKFKQNSYA